MAGVVLVAALTVAVPAFGSVPGAAVPATAPSALLCPVATTTGGTGIVRTLRPAHATKAATKSRRGRRRRRAHHRAAPCIPRCRWLSTDLAGATGPTGPTDCAPPHVCPPPAPEPQRNCPPIGCVTGPSGPTGATPPCPPLPCPLAVPGAPGAATGVTGPPLRCRPLPCPIPMGMPSGATTPAIVCPRPPICPLGNAIHTSECAPPCVVAGPAGPTGGGAACPPVPNCPPPQPATAIAAADSALHACPEIPTAAAGNG